MWLSAKFGEKKRKYLPCYGYGPKDVERLGLAGSYVATAVASCCCAAREGAVRVALAGSYVATAVASCCLLLCV